VQLHIQVERRSRHDYLPANFGREEAMVKLPPPVWTVLYLLIAAGASYLAGWPRISGLPFVPLGVLLIIAGVALAVTAARGHGDQSDLADQSQARHFRTFQFHPQSDVPQPGDHRAGDRLLGRRLADVPGPDRGFCNGELGAYTVRGGEDAPPIRRGL
jgi:hypothetical protein